MPKRIVPLTGIKIKNTKPSTKDVKLFDGGGLFVLITPTGGKEQEHHVDVHSVCNPEFVKVALIPAEDPENGIAQLFKRVLF